MWSSSSKDKQQHHKCLCLNKNLIATNSSKSSSTTSSSFSLSNNHHPPNLRLNKTMEEVWKDINLSSLNDKTCSSRDIDPQNTTTNNIGSTILQDFLARPLANNPPIAIGHDSAAPPPPHVTMLTLNSGLEFNFFNNLRQNTNSNQKTISQVGSLNRSFDAYANGRKRYNEESENISCDQKHKRMIKNRESAARSRARKQAYTGELELEIAQLMKENAKLKKQLQQLCLAAAAHLPKKNSLYRTSTAPF